MALGGHGTINDYSDGEIRLVIRPQPVLYTLKEVVIALWNEDKSYDLYDDEEIVLCETMWGITKRRINGTKKGLVEYLSNNVYFNHIANPDDRPHYNTDESYELIPEGCRNRIRDYIILCAPKFGEEKKELLA